MFAHDLFIAGYFDDEELQGYRRHTVKHCGINQRLYRVDPHKINNEADQRCYYDDAIKSPGLMWLQVQTRLPVERFGYLISRRTGKDRHCQHTQANYAY